MKTSSRRFSTPATLATVALAAGTGSGLGQTLFDTPYEVNPPVNGAYPDTQPGGVYTETFGAWTATLSASSFSATRTVDTINSPTSLLLSLYAPASGGGTVSSFGFTSTVPMFATTGMVTFDYAYSESDGWQVASLYYLYNGTPTLITSTPVSGSISFAVNPGDTFGFYINGGYYSTNSVTISNFSAPVPEPSSLALLATGFAGLLGMRRLRRRES